MVERLRVLPVRGLPEQVLSSGGGRTLKERKRRWRGHLYRRMRDVATFGAQPKILHPDQ